MEYDREGEFDRVMEEITPVSIPSNFSNILGQFSFDNCI